MMATCTIRLPQNPNISRWAAPLTPLAMTFMAMVEHANMDATPLATQSTQAPTPRSDHTEPQT